MSGFFGGAVAPQASLYEVFEDSVYGPTLEVKIKKLKSEGVVEMWSSFLSGEKAEPTVQFAGTCEVTGARFFQHRDFFDVELDVPANLAPSDLTVDLEPNKWTISYPGFRTNGDLLGRVVPDDSAWLLDDLSKNRPRSRQRSNYDDDSWDGKKEDNDDQNLKTLYMTLRKERAPGGNISWWPGLTVRKSTPFVEEEDE